LKEQEGQSVDLPLSIARRRRTRKKGSKNKQKAGSIQEKGMQIAHSSERQNGLRWNSELSPAFARNWQTMIMGGIQHK